MFLMSIVGVYVAITFNLSFITFVFFRGQDQNTLLKD